MSSERTAAAGGHAATIEQIDVRHLGRERVVCVYRVGDVIVDCGPTSALENLEAGLGGVAPRALLLTHIHLDHAGAAGVLTRRYPELQVYVHERGAPHLADPAKLLASATRLYGDEMDRLWGEFAAVPVPNLHVLGGGETVEGFEVAYTPGHASHHVSYRHLETGAVFTGDVAGISIQPSEFVLPPTPPPDIDIERWFESIDLIERWAPSALCLTHFGAVTDVAGHLARLRARLTAFAELSEAGDARAFADYVTRERDSALDPETAESLKQAGPPDQLWLGLERYWRKRREAAAAVVSDSP